MTALSSVIGRGTNASRPAAGIPGALYFSTDVSGGTLYRDNGSSWDACLGPGLGTVSTKTANYTVVGGDHGTTFIANAASLVFTLPAPATAGSGFWVRLKNSNQTTTGFKTAASGQTVDGVDCSTTAGTTGLTTAYGAVMLICDGSAYWTVATDNTATGGGGGSSTLAGDSDVSISSPASGDALIYNGTAWANKKPWKVQLNYALASDVSALSTGTATWTDVIANQSFTVDDGNSNIEVFTNVITTCVPTAATRIGFRLNIDSGAQTVIVGGGITSNTSAGDAQLAFASAVLSALSAGTHTIKLQVYTQSAGSSLYCRASTVPTEQLKLTVIERK